MNFNEYWKKKSAKRRKSWTAKAKRYAENHNQLEDIRKEVYLPLDFSPNFRLDDLKPVHFTDQNPLVRWDKALFSFSEEDLRADLKAQGADMSTFRMEVSRESIEGKAAPLPENSYGLNEWEDYRYGKPNRVYDSDRFYFDWILRMYNICTDMETVRLSYRQISMTIRRYSNAGRPFAYYELNPCEQLCHSAILFQETDFYTLDVATLLMDMAGEFELRKEELNFYAKQLKLRSMEAAITDSIDFTLWDDKKKEKKMEEYRKKGYSLDKMIDQILRPWKAAVSKYFDAAAERSLAEPSEKLAGFNAQWSSSRYFIERVFCPYLKKEGMEMAGLEDVEVVIEDELRMTVNFQGYSCSVQSSYNGVFFYPNSHYESCCIALSLKTPLSAIAAYLRMMPVINRKTDDEVIRIMHIFDRMNLQDEEYRDNLAFLEPLMSQSAGKPVGKLMKYIRWNLGCLYSGRIFPLRSIKITGDRSFSFMQKDTPYFTSTAKGSQSVALKDVEIERWLDEQCHNIYSTPDPETKEKMWTFQEFAKYYLIPELTLSIDFIDQKL